MFRTALPRAMGNWYSANAGPNDANAQLPQDRRALRPLESHSEV